MFLYCTAKQKGIFLLQSGHNLFAGEKYSAFEKLSHIGAIMKALIPLITDTLFTLFISFILSFILVSAFLQKPYSYVLSAMLSALIGLMAFKILSSKKSARASKAKKDKEYLNAMTQFAFMTKADVCTFFKSLLEKQGYKVEKRRSYIKIKDKNALIAFGYGFDAVTKTDVVKAYNLKNQSDTVYLLAEKFTDEVKVFSSRFDNLKLADGNDVYSYLKEKDFLPKTKYSFKQNKFDKLKALKSLLGRKNSKRFALFGITFLIMSYFVPIKLYYIIVGGIFCTLSLICLLFGKTANTV